MRKTYKQFDELVPGDRFYMTDSNVGQVVTVEVDRAPQAQPYTKRMTHVAMDQSGKAHSGLVLEGHDVASGTKWFAYGQAGKNDKRELDTSPRLELRAEVGDTVIETVDELLDALDARGDDVSAAAAHLIRSIGARHPDVLDVENAEL